MAKSLIPTEYESQCTIIRWARTMAETGQIPQLALLHGDASGIRVSIGAAVKMKRAGAIKGWPDLFLPIPIKNHYGLFIELKRIRGGHLSDEQRHIHAMLTHYGYQVSVCRGADEAIKAITQYLEA